MMSPAHTPDVGPKIPLAEFAYAAAAANQFPPMSLPEVAFGGRSNVGKSSLLNTMLARKSLVRTSRSPGCTRQINFFRVRTDAGAEMFFVDLPGYGFAARSKTEKAGWGTLIESYLQSRETMCALTLLVDIRRGVEADDAQLIEFWEHSRPKAPILLVATKLDKLPLSKRVGAVAALEHSVKRKVVGFSAVLGDGRARLWRDVLHVVA